MIKDEGLSFETQLKIEFLPPNNGSKKCLEKSLLYIVSSGGLVDFFVTFLIIQSSLNRLNQTKLSERSLINIKKKRGPRIDP